MTRSSGLTPSASTRRRAEALGVDVGVMDAIDHLGPRLPIEKWKELASIAGRPVEDVMLDELVPEHGLGMSCWEPDRADDSGSSADPEDAYEEHMREARSRGSAPEQRTAGHHPTEREWEDASDRWGPALCSREPWVEDEEGNLWLP